MEYLNESNEEFSKRMDILRKEAQERFDNMTPEQQQGLLAAQRRHQRKVRDEIETSFVIETRRKLEITPTEVSEAELKEYLAILERDRIMRENKQ
jgi:hypothetical protein